MPYRLVTRSRKLAGKLAGHSRRHAQRVATSAADPYRERLPAGSQTIDLEDFQTFLGQDLARFEAELRAMDDLHARQLQRVRNLRDLRRGRVRDLRESLLQLKKTSDGYWGPGADQKIFQEDPRLPDDAAALCQLALRVYDTLTDPQFRLPSAQPGVVVNPRLLAGGFAGPLAALADVLKRLDDAESESKHTQSVKDAKLEQLGHLTGQVFRFYESLYKLAGHDRLAKRLRLSSHTRGDGEPEAGAPPPESAPDVTGDDGDGSGGSDSVDGGARDGDDEAIGPIFAAATQNNQEVLN